MEAPVLLPGLEDFREENGSIFDEIETLLKRNKILDKSNFSHVKKTHTKDNFHKNCQDANVVNGDFFSSCPAQDFLLSDETHNFTEDPQLYSVERDELQPITSPFMVPGIYRKISTTPTKPSFGQGLCSEAPNVFVSEKELHGRIVSTQNFSELYTFAKENTKTIKARRVLPVKHLNRKEIEKPMPEAVSNEIDSKQMDMMLKLAYNIHKLSERDHIVIDRENNEIVRTENGTNQKTIYRFLSPHNLGHKSPEEKLSSETPPCALKLTPKAKWGRPRKYPQQERPSLGESSKKVKMQQIREIKKKEVASKAAVFKSQASELRTRSGRVVKPLNPPVESKTLEESMDDPPEESAELFRNLLAELKDADFHYSKPLPSQNSLPNIADNNTPDNLAIDTPTKRRVPPEAICPTCKKIFLGRRLKRHFTQYPDHMQSNQIPPPDSGQSTAHCANTNNTTEDVTLFRFLMSKLQKSNLNEDQRADLFLNEINDLVEQLQMRSSRLIRNTSGLHFVTTRSARVLGIPEGQYALDMSAIEAPPEPENNYEHKSITTIPAVNSVNTRSLDYTAISLDDTLTDEAAQKLNLSAGGKLLPPSEESLLRAVDDLVHEGITKLVDTNLLHPPENSSNVTQVETLMPHYDHASDNAVEAVSMKETTTTQQAAPILDLTVDFFQFNNN